MAEAIARHLLASQAVRTMKRGGRGGAMVLVRSAGVGASEGEPATPEARRALKSLGIELGAHKSKPVTVRMIEDADEVLGMTETHVRALQRLAPQATDRIHAIDPEGDIPDPIGGSDELYETTARRLLDLIRSRFQTDGVIDAEHDGR